MGEASVGSSTDTSEFCSITYLQVDGSFDMSWMVSCCIGRGFSDGPLTLLLPQSLSSSSLSRLLVWISRVSLGSLRHKNILV